MPVKCRPDVKAVRAQTESMLAEAAKVISEVSPQLSGPKKKAYELVSPAQRSAEHCMPRLESARAAFAAAEQESGALAQRDGYVRATYQAGQALSCARTAKIGTKLSVAPIIKPQKPKKSKAPQQDEE